MKPVADSPSAPAIALRIAIITAIHFLTFEGSMSFLFFSIIMLVFNCIIQSRLGRTNLDFNVSRFVFTKKKPIAKCNIYARRKSIANERNKISTKARITTIRTINTISTQVHSCSNDLERENLLRTEYPSCWRSTGCM